MSQVVGDLNARIGADTSGLKKGFSDIKKETSALSNTIGKIGGVIAGAFAVNSIIAFTKECVELSSAAKGVTDAFKRMGGTESSLDNLRKATRGTVGDLELMKAAVQANNFGIPLQQLGSLLAFAHQRAKDTGQSVDYLVQSIVLGIGRKSPLILDNLGISAVQLREKFAGLGAEQKSVADVAKAVGEIATESMSKVKKSVDTVGESIDRNKATIEKWKIAIGDALSGTYEWFVNIVGKVDELIKKMAKLSEAETLTAFQKIGSFISPTANKNNAAILAMEEALKRQASQIAESFMTRLGNTLKDKGNIEKATQFVEDLKFKIIEEFGKFEGVDITKISKEDQLQFFTLRKELIAITNLLKNPTEIDKYFEISSDPARTLEVINQELDDYNKLLKKTDILQQDELIEIQKTIKALEEEKKGIEGLSESYEMYMKDMAAAKKLRLAKESDAAYLKNAPSFNPLSINTRVSSDKIKLPPLETKEYQESLENLIFFNNNYITSAQLTQAEMDNFATNWTKNGGIIVDVTQTLTQGIADGIGNMAEAIGSLIVGVNSLDDVGKAFLGMMADFMSTLGKQLVAVGVAAMIVKTSLATNPAAAIAAGTVLMALAGAVKATLNKGASGGGYSGTSSAAYSTVNTENQKVEFIGVLKGSDIYWSQKNFGKKLSNTT